MNLMDVNPIKSGGNCFDDILETAGRWFGCDHMLVYAFSLKMSFNAENTLNTVGQRLVVDFMDYFHLLDKYHGFLLQIHNQLTAQEAMALIYEQWKKGNPVGVYFNSYYAPWDPFYLTTHSLIHIFLVVGINDQTGDLYCVDPFYEKKNLILPFDHFQQGFRSCLTFELAPTKVTLDKVQLFQDLRQQLSEYAESKHTLNHMLALANALSTFDISAESQGNNSFGETSIFLRLGILISRRINFARMLTYLDSRYNAPALIPIADKINELAASWTLVRGLITKMNMMHKINASTQDILSKIIDKIKANAYAEDQLLKPLIEALDNKTTFEQDKSSAITQLDEDHAVIGSIVHVDLESLFTNRAFDNASHTANFDSEGHYFTRDCLPVNGRLDIEDMSFSFPAGQIESCDNLSCVGQFVEVVPDSYKGFMVLGCSEMGSYLDRMTIEYVDGTTEQTALGFADWWSRTPINQEILAAKFNLLHHQRGKMPNEVYLHAKKTALSGGKPIKRFILPFMPNIHLFALSMWK